MSIDDERRALEAELAYWEKLFTAMPVSEALAMVDAELHRQREMKARLLEGIEERLSHLAPADIAMLKEEVSAAFKDSLALLERCREKFAEKLKS